MRRQAALVALVPILLVAACAGSGGSSAATANVGPLRHATSKACAASGSRTVAYLLGGSSENVPKVGDLKAVRAKVATLPRRKRDRTIQSMANAAIVICDQMLHGVAWSTAAVQVFDIPSESMIPALKPGDKILVNRIGYKVAEPERGDIAVFRAPAIVSASSGVQDLVKRIVGLPGETIEGRGGRILIDGSVIPERYLPRDVQSRTFGPELIPAGQYFMIGDNRQYSQDSTYFGPIPRDDLIGPATKL